VPFADLAKPVSLVRLVLFLGFLLLPPVLTLLPVDWWRRRRLCWRRRRLLRQLWTHRGSVLAFDGRRLRSFYLCRCGLLRRPLPSLPSFDYGGLRRLRRLLLLPRLLRRLMPSGRRLLLCGLRNRTRRGLRSSANCGLIIGLNTLDPAHIDDAHWSARRRCTLAYLLDVGRGERAAGILG
jgi:hypothetical protein